MERKNSGSLAEQAGEPGPHRFQPLLGRAVWEAEEVRDDLQAYVREHLSAPDAVLMVDETGFLKKGDHRGGVQRQSLRHGGTDRERRWCINPCEGFSAKMTG